MFSSAVARPLQLVTRVLQWASAVIVMGLSAYFVHEGPRGLSITFQLIVSAISVVFFLPAFVSPFLPSALGKFVLLIDVVFSYLWLTAFIFAAQDYNRHNCFFRAPPWIPCGRKKANESFIFLAFFFTFIGMFLEVAALWAYRRENVTPAHPEKNGVPAAAAPADAPAVATV